MLREDFDRDRPLQTRVARLVHLAHAALPERREDLVRAETRRCWQRQAEKETTSVQEVHKDLHRRRFYNPASRNQGPLIGATSRLPQISSTPRLTCEPANKTGGVSAQSHCNARVRHRSCGDGFRREEGGAGG